ncbi:hypothetical protein CDV31_001993 [Fusarium ambrosium]|uniref:Uncharacterized protein n=1 Tax=Fusarium ambrosium TaxID=131363 RepID=A0A428UXT0_9HYPO|nr:hypothetical protein CDV31_001993 [Fusarium ambrosium]
MSYNRRCIGLILACMVGVAHADPWDDFANNLFTDLAPLLALFGERTTMQFMSQALGWEDCLLLAMAPLGIITILVSAIRVGGPAWLKAVVGRARENISAAEMELMSSTSKEVCELYNGQTIVRCQGSTPVWEFIYLIPTTLRNQNSHKKLDIRVLTLEEACSRMARIFRKVFAKSSPSSTRDASVERGFAPHEAIYVIRNMSSDAPNIILNLQSNNSNRKELQAFASVGVILQMCVVAFFGIITYHPTIKNTFRKDNKRVNDYAFPLAVSGTLVLALGVFLCGTVVESSTRETHYKRNDKYEMRIVWIQQKQTVGDQVFEPFATFPNTPRNVVTMSRRCDKVEARSLEPLTIIGICAGLAGFIIQFIGLRGMNSAATLAQLGVVGIMTVIRAQKTDQLIQDLRWWAPETFDVLSEIQDLDGLDEDGSTGRPVGDGENRPIFSLESETRKELDQIFKRNTKLDAILIDDKRVVGYGPPRPQSLGGSGRQRHFRNFSILRDSDKRKKKRGVLAIESRDSLEKLYAKDLLFSFLISAAKTLPKTLQSKVETRDSNASTIINGASKVLLTQELTSLAAEFDRLGYGTEQEVWASTIAAFSVAEKLPSPRPLFDIGRERAEKFRQEGKWSDANREYLNLWKQTQCYVSSFQDIYARGTVLLIEHFHNLTDHRVILRGGDAGLVQALVNKGVGVNIPWKMNRGSSPLHVAAQKGMDDIIKIVLVALDGLGPETRSSVLELRDDFKLTALHHATVHKHLEVVKLLLAAGADPNKIDGINSTVLHKVFVFCEGKQAICLELAKILVEHNANPQAQNGYGETPLDMAMGEGHTEAAEYLKGFSVHEVA